MTREPRNSAMTQAQFQALLEAYGAASERWPADRRAAALALLERSAAARLARAEAAELDALLDRATAEPPSAALRARILAAAPAPAVPARSAMPAAPRRRRWRVAKGRVAEAIGQLWPGGPAWRPALALTGALMLGLAVGYAAPPPVLAGSSEPAVVSGLDNLIFGVLEPGETLL